ncbi:MAG: AraC family ligand binding domain-containing protein, partial [Clostridia bacterium]|nr:AraC family ligand binding domain-containing protein [Clostridia bacterium]
MIKKTLTGYYLTDEKIAIQTALGNADNLHGHDFLELAYIKKGKARHFFENSKADVSEGDYFIIDYGVLHSYTSLDETQTVTVVNCLFQPGFIDKTIAASCDSFNTLLGSYMIRASGNGINTKMANIIFHDDTGEVGALLEKMRIEYQNKNAGYLEILRCSLIEIIILTMRKMNIERSFELGDATCEQIKHYVDENYMKNISLSDISRELNFSLPYLSRLFTSKAGICFSEYLQNVRIEQSLKILANTNAKLFEVA